jgi:hypothetical protein
MLSVRTLQNEVLEVLMCKVSHVNFEIHASLNVFSEHSFNMLKVAKKLSSLSFSIPCHVVLQCARFQAEAGTSFTKLHFLRNLRMRPISSCYITLGWKGLPMVSASKHTLLMFWSWFSGSTTHPRNNMSRWLLNLSFPHSNGWILHEYHK